MELDTIHNMDCMEGMRGMADGSIDLAIIDPPYNVGVETSRNGKARRNDWDRIDNYLDWMLAMLNEVSRVLKSNGVLYLWHNDMAQISELLHRLHKETPFRFRSFCIWDKGDSYRAKSWRNLRPDGRTPLRSWFNVCEYCLHFFNGSGRNPPTGMQAIYSNPECFKPLKEWYRSEMERLGLSKADIRKAYCEATGKGGGMLRHYFTDSQFEIPTRDVWESVFEPLGFDFHRQGYEGLRQGYEGLRQEYEGLRQEYEGLRHTHNMDRAHCNIWHRPPLKTQGRLHTCQKPLGLLERLVLVSSNEGETVLDTCMGSGSTAIAAMNTGRHFIGFEKEKEYFDIAMRRIEDARMQTRLAL